MLFPGDFFPRGPRGLLQAGGRLFFAQIVPVRGRDEAFGALGGRFSLPLPLHLRRAGFQLRTVPVCLLQIGKQAVLLLSGGNPARQRRRLRARGPAAGGNVPGLFFVRRAGLRQALRKRPGRADVLLLRKLLESGFREGGPVRRSGGGILKNGAGVLFQRGLQLLLARLQGVLYPAVNAGVEDAAENFGPFGAVGEQQLEELALGDHGGLPELLAVDAEQAGDFCGHRARARADRAVRAGQRGVGALRRHPAFLFRAAVARVPPDRVEPARMGEGQLHKGLGVRRGEIAAQGLRRAGGAAGLAVKGEGNRVENRGLARPGVAANQKKAGAAELFQRHLRAAGIGAERAHHKVQRLHASSSSLSAASTAFSSSARSGSGSSRPCCFR